MDNLKDVDSKCECSCCSRWRNKLMSLDTQNGHDRKKMNKKSNQGNKTGSSFQFKSKPIDDTGMESFKAFKSEMGLNKSFNSQRITDHFDFVFDNSSEALGLLDDWRKSKRTKINHKPFTDASDSSNRSEDIKFDDSYCLDWEVVNVCSPQKDTFNLLNCEAQAIKELKNVPISPFLLSAAAIDKNLNSNEKHQDFASCNPNRSVYLFGNENLTGRKASIEEVNQKMKNMKRNRSDSVMNLEGYESHDAFETKFQSISNLSSFSSPPENPHSRSESIPETLSGSLSSECSVHFECDYSTPSLGSDKRANKNAFSIKIVDQLNKKSSYIIEPKSKRLMIKTLGYVININGSQINDSVIDQNP